jgi:hypothetical protein
MYKNRKELYTKGVTIQTQRIHKTENRKTNIKRIQKTQVK